MIQLTQVHATDIEFLKFIERIYTESFPPDERRDFSDVIRLLEENDDFFIVLLSDENKAVGFISYWEWNDFSYVEHFAVDSSCRGSGNVDIRHKSMAHSSGCNRSRSICRTCYWSNSRKMSCARPSCRNYNNDRAFFNKSSNCRIKSCS